MARQRRALIIPIMTTSTNLSLLIEAREAARTGKGASIREAAGLSRGELARAAGLHEATVGRYESGARVPRGDAAIRYARLLRRLASTVEAQVA